MLELFHDGIDDSDEDDHRLRLKQRWGGGGLNCCRCADLTAVLEQMKSTSCDWSLVGNALVEMRDSLPH